MEADQLRPTEVPVLKLSKCIWINQTCVVKDESDLNLEKAVDSKTYRMKLTAVWVKRKQLMLTRQKDIEKYAELTEVYSSSPSLGHPGLELVGLGFEVKQCGGRAEGFFELGQRGEHVCLRNLQHNSGLLIIFLAGSGSTGAGIAHW